LAKYEVKETFRDKETLELHVEGDLYETTDVKRAEFLQNHGYLGEKVKKAKPSSNEGEKE
jgi:hypothetical protein